MAREGNLEVDAPAVRDAAESAIATLQQAQKIRSNLTAVKTSADKARDGLNDLVESVRSQLERIESLVEEALSADADG